MFMEEVLHDVLQAEETAEKSVREANAKRDEIRSTAEAKINEMLNKAKSSVQQTIRERIHAAKTNASEARDRAIEEAEEEAAHFLESNKDRIAALVDEVCGLIIAPELTV